MEDKIEYSKCTHQGCDFIFDKGLIANMEHLYIHPLPITKEDKEEIEIVIFTSFHMHEFLTKILKENI